jgi:heme-degrading monooxygenase HmoA
VAALIAWQDYGVRSSSKEGRMIVMFTARRLKPGAWEQFRRAWEPEGGDAPPGFQRAYHARNLRDEDEIISFGLFDMTEEDYRRWRGEADAGENARVDRLSAFVENEHVSGVYEVIDEVEELG